MQQFRLISAKQLRCRLANFEAMLNTTFVDVSAFPQSFSLPGFYHVPIASLSKTHFRSPTGNFVLFGDAKIDAANLAVACGVPHGNILLVADTPETQMSTIAQPFVYNFHSQTSGTNTYIVVSEAQCVIIDPVLGFDVSTGKIDTHEADLLLEFIAENKIKCTHILETHVHADHITSAAYLKAKLNAPVCIGAGIKTVFESVQKLLRPQENYQKSAFCILWNEGDEFEFGGITCKILDTPGHTPDSISYVIGDSVFCGDSLFNP